MVKVHYILYENILMKPSERTPIKEKGIYKSDMLPLFSSNNGLHFVFEPRYLN